MKSRKNSKTHNHLKQYLTAYHTVIFCEVARRQRVSKLSAHSPNVMCFKNAVPKMKRIDSNVFAPGSTVKNIFTYQHTWLLKLSYPLLNGSNNPVLVPKLWSQDAQRWFLSSHTRVHMASNARNAVHGVRKSRNSKKHVEPSSLNTTILEFDSQLACSFANCVIDVKTFVRNSTSQILVCQCITSNWH